MEKKRKGFLKKSLLTVAALATLYLAEQNNGYIEHGIGSHLQNRQEVALETEETSFTAFGMQFPTLEQRLKEGTAIVTEENDIIIKDRKGNILAEKLHLERYTALDKISPEMQWAMVAAEDLRFYQHNGIDHGSTLSALWRNATNDGSKRRRGASTLSIQLADMLLEDQPTWKETKKHEWSYALLIEEQKTKQEILESYLNTAVFGHSRREKKDIKGIRAASRYYFNKEPIELDLTESVVLASMVNHPSAYGTRMYSDIIFNKKDKEESRSFQRMLDRAGYILETLDVMKTIYGDDILPEEAITTAKRKIRYGKVHLHKNGRYAVARDVSEYVDVTLDRVALLVEEHGIQESTVEVTATIDRDFQHFVRDMFMKHKERIRTRLEKDDSFKNPEQISGSIVVIDTKTDDVLAIVGGAGIQNGDYMNRAIIPYINPGSTVKPFMLAIGLDRGYTKDSTFVDEKRTYEIKQGRRTVSYTPRNYDSFTGRSWTLHDALVASKNSVFLALTDEMLTTYGEGEMREQMQEFGFPLEYFHLSSALGTFPVSTMDIAGAYSTLANECVPREHVGGEKNRRYTSSVTVDGSALEISSEAGGRACDQFTAWEIDASLADVVEGNRYTGTTNTVFPVRGKTGTAPYNIVFAGYQPELEKLVVVSFASDNPTITGKLPREVTGGGYAAPAAMDIFDYLALER